LKSADGNGVMMGWEEPLMDLHAERLMLPWVKHGREGDYSVLNIGFGLGLIDSSIQRIAHDAPGALRHTIIEAHTDVLKKMADTGWNEKATVVAGTWQCAVERLGPFDAIFYDAFSEYYRDMRALHQELPRLLKPGGVYSYFNGLAADQNPFFHEVAYRTAEVELNDLGFDVEYEQVDMHLEDEVWNGIRKNYFSLDVYTLPTCTRRVIGAERGAAEPSPGERSDDPS